jgi:osmotically-inducible protein OsmY
LINRAIGDTYWPTAPAEDALFAVVDAGADDAGLAGVRNIRDETEIWVDADPVGVTLLVQDALDRNALVADDSDVEVGTSGNTVALTGHVRTWAEHDAVVAAAWMAEGVMDVVDELNITG